MTRFYKRPILLIEFDPNKSFSLQVSVPKGAVTQGNFSYSLLYVAKRRNGSYFIHSLLTRHVHQVLHRATSCANCFSTSQHKIFRDSVVLRSRHSCLNHNCENAVTTRVKFMTKCLFLI